MKVVGIREFKDRLSEYVRMARRGEDIWDSVFCPLPVGVSRPDEGRGKKSTLAESVRLWRKATCRTAWTSWISLRSTRHSASASSSPACYGTAKRKAWRR